MSAWFIKSNSSRATSAKVGQSFTSASLMPCTAVTSAGMGIVGFRRMVFHSCEPSTCIFKRLISTIRSAVMLMPVVSRSKTTKGRVKLSKVFGIDRWMMEGVT